MDFGKILSQLRLERDMIQQAIESMEKLATSHRGRGRPLGSTNELPRKRGRPKGSKSKPASAVSSTSAGPNF
jgi:hypothetical protein